MLNNTIIFDVATFDVNDTTQIKNTVGDTRLDSWFNVDAERTPYNMVNDCQGDVTHQTSEELPLLGLPPFIQPTAQANDYRSYNKTLGVYGQGTYSLADATGVSGLGAIAGVRYTSEEVSPHFLPISSNNAQVIDTPLAEAAIQEKAFWNVGWTLGLQEQANDDRVVYVVSRRNYRNGGFNGTLEAVIGTGSQGSNAYLTETVTEGAVGAKFQGTVASLPVQASVAAYSVWISNRKHVAYSVDALGVPAPISINVPRSRVNGLVLNAKINPIDWLRIGATYNYTDAKFTSNLVEVSAVVKNAFDKVNYSDGTEAAEIFRNNTAILGDRRTYPVQARYKFLASPWLP